MPLASARIRIDRQAQDLDPVYWEWAVDGADFDDISALELVNATLTGLENGIAAVASSTFVNSTADLIELFPGVGGPAYYVQGLAPGIVIGTGGAGIQVGQCAVNELTESPRGLAATGRMFVGPFSNTAASKLGAIQRTAAVRVMQEMASAHLAAGFTPVVISRFLANVERPTPVGLEVLGFRADLRWDILRSRRDPAPNSSQDFPLEFA